MLVYDITNEKSFENIKNWIRNIEEVKHLSCFFYFIFLLLKKLTTNRDFLLIQACCFLQHASADVERMVLGNKCDVNDRRQVSKERGEQVKTGSLQFQSSDGKLCISNVWRVKFSAADV